MQRSVADPKLDTESQANLISVNKFFEWKTLRVTFRSWRTLAPLTKFLQQPIEAMPASILGKQWNQNTNKQHRHVGDSQSDLIDCWPAQDIAQALANTNTHTHTHTHTQENCH